MSSSSPPCRAPKSSFRLRTACSFLERGLDIIHFHGSSKWGNGGSQLQWAVDIRSNWRRAQELELLCAVATVIPATRNPRNQSAQFQRESFLETHQIGKEASKIRNKSLWYEHRWELTAKWYNIDNIDHNWFNKHVRPISLEITNLQFVNINRLLLLYGDRRLNI